MSESIRKIFLKLRKDERGATLVEYGVALLVAIIAGGTFLTSLASETNSNYTDATTAAATR
ncbi:MULTISPECIES: Flp family type IVb pilin [unclassified Ruegeria]|uniref:Flp family type IVb pilin n=1 Tax=unclassified Ruegeria TaxID=2625375 RepID=UPI0015836FA8|nr:MULTISPECIES: Flp family type IVb pilin [unclassified Ruegeria]